MKKYNIIVNGTAYAVEVEEAGASAAAPAAAPAPVPAAAPAAAKEEAPAPAPAAAPSAAPSAGAKTVECPMPGTILDIRVKPGDAVKAGDVLLILEAMKMENEIIAPNAGTIDTIQVSKGSSVNAGDVCFPLNSKTGREQINKFYSRHIDVAQYGIGDFFCPMPVIFDFRSFICTNRILDERRNKNEWSLG